MLAHAERFDAATSPFLNRFSNDDWVDRNRSNGNFKQKCLELCRFVNAELWVVHIPTRKSDGDSATD